jgi:AbiV family abortive infection protein
MDEVYIAIVLNAQRLMLDAKLLAAHGSFQSAVSLAILSLEESGKACIVRWKRSGLITRDISKDLYVGHIPKQRILGAYHFVKAAYEVAFFDKDGNPVEPPDNDETVERAAKAGYKSGGRMIFYAESGALDFMKMAGFYVDLNDKLEVMSKGGDIQAGDAARHIRDAELGIEMARAPPRIHRGMAAVYELGAHHKIRRRSRELHEAVWAGIGHANLDDE